MPVVSQPAYFNIQEFTSQGDLGDQMRLYTYAPSTTTQKTVYTDSAGTIPHTYVSDGIGGLYIALNARGELPAPVFCLSGGYDFSLKTAAGASVWTRRVEAPGVDISVAFAASSGSTSVGYTEGGTGSSTRTVQDKLRELGVFASDMTGYDTTGSADSTTAIQNAINEAITKLTRTVYITGTPKITAALTYTGAIALIGVGGEEIFTNDFDKFPVRIKCGGVTGYLFDQPDVADGNGSLTLRNICFDGRTSGSTRSTTWTGLVKASTTSGTSSFYLRMHNCAAGYSDSTSALLNLSGEVFSETDDSYFVMWPNGYGIQTTGANILGTTITFRKSYFSNIRQVGEFYDNTTDVEFNDCVMESSIVGVAAYKSTVIFSGSTYSENMGYDPIAGGRTTGLTPRAFGVADVPAISGDVSAVFTCRYGQMIFDHLVIQNTTGGKKWFDGIGRSSAGGNGGQFMIRDITFAAGSISTLFTADADSPSSKANFEYHLTCKIGTAVVPDPDARLLTTGRVPTQWSDGVIYESELRDKLYVLHDASTATPTIYPTGGVVLGDIVERTVATLGSGAERGWVCTTAGTSGAAWQPIVTNKGQGVNSLTYSASITPNANLGRLFGVSVTNNTAFTINTPTGGFEGQEFTIRIYNVSGGAMGAITWGAGLHLAGAFTNPANGTNRSITFNREGGIFYERYRTAADVTN